MDELIARMSLICYEWMGEDTVPILTNDLNEMVKYLEEYKSIINMIKDMNDVLEDYILEKNK